MDILKAIIEAVGETVLKVLAIGAGIGAVIILIIIVLIRACGK